MELRSLLLGWVVGCGMGGGLGVLAFRGAVAAPLPLAPEPTGSREVDAYTERETSVEVARPSPERETLAASKEARSEAPSSDLGSRSIPVPQQVTWDPLARYRELCRAPDPRTQPWEEVAAGLEQIAARPEAIDSWWQVFRRDPEHERAAGAIERLAPALPLQVGALQRRIEEEIERFPVYFHEREEMERRLAPLLLEQGRAAEAFEICRLDRWLRRLRKRERPNSLNFTDIYPWRILMAHDPGAAEELLMRALDSGNPPKEAFRLLLTLLRDQNREADANALEQQLSRFHRSWASARHEIGWPPDERRASEILEDDPWDGRRIDRAHAELVRDNRHEQARELLMRALADVELEPVELVRLVEGDRAHRVSLLVERLERDLASLPTDPDLHHDSLLQLGDALTLLGNRADALRAYRHLAALYPEQTPYERLRNLELGRGPED